MLTGGVIPRGASIIVAIGGANRDPDVFEEPDRLRLGRPDASRHLSFPHPVGKPGASCYLRATPAQTEKVPGTSMTGRHCWT